MVKKRLCPLLFIASLVPSPLFAKDDFVGEWYACQIDSDASHEVMHITKKGKSYQVLREYGGSYSYAGQGVLKNNTLKFLGCNYYRDETMDNCNILQPNTSLNIEKSILKHNVKNIERSLKKSDWILISGQNTANFLTSRCDELRNKKYLDEDGWPKDF